MSDEMIVRHCSPTLAGMKTASMFACQYADVNEMRESIRHKNRLFRNKGLRVLPLKYKDNRALIYFYRPSHLMRDLQQDTACRLLSERGYKTENPEQCIYQLIKRLEKTRNFLTKSDYFSVIRLKMFADLSKTRQKNVNALVAGRFTQMKNRLKKHLQNTKNVQMFIVRS